jgi:hypothetical protein
LSGLQSLVVAGSKKMAVPVIFERRRVSVRRRPNLADELRLLLNKRGDRRRDGLGF